VRLLEDWSAADLGARGRRRGNEVSVDAQLGADADRLLVLVFLSLI
jgi:hypothetical protein